MSLIHRYPASSITVFKTKEKGLLAFVFPFPKPYIYKSLYDSRCLQQSQPAVGASHPVMFGMKKEVVEYEGKKPASPQPETRLPPDSFFWSSRRVMSGKNRMGCVAEWLHIRCGRHRWFRDGGSYSFSSRMPSASSRLRASSRAQVCMLVSGL